MWLSVLLHVSLHIYLLKNYFQRRQCQVELSLAIHCQFNVLISRLLSYTNNFPLITVIVTPSLCTNPVKVEGVCPDHPESVEGVEPEEDDHQAHQEAPGVAVVDGGGLRGAVVVPTPGLVVPPPAQQTINIFM